MDSYLFYIRKQIFWSTSNSAVRGRINNAANNIPVHVIANVVTHGLFESAPPGRVQRAEKSHTEQRQRRRKKFEQKRHV